MEGKSPALSVVVIGVLLMGLVFSHTPVEAKSCCQNTLARNCYNVCRFAGGSREACAKACNCKIITETDCPSDYPKLNSLQNTETDEETDTKEAYATSDFCKLGCASFVCSNIMAFHKSTAGLVSELEESAKEAAKSCNDACFQFCNKKSESAVVAAI
ncbi:hypothetical protein MKX03_008820 [Papaver bracteatum]|nr:hypothetical protein MKX03_008819 [Papaver bracteatum]KAI3880556.1 hypothetical protein MKX03_008820 [Papaver bracteatum]